MEWFYAKNNQQLGPVSFEVLSGMVQRGELSPDDLVWRDGMPNWVAASGVPELASIISGASPTIGYFNPVAAARVFSPVYAGFWLRFWAFLIDTFLLMFVGFIVNAVTRYQRPLMPMPGRTPFFFLDIFAFRTAMEWIIGWIYFALLESSQSQATIGKMALGLIVTDMNGQRITFARASGRYWGKYLSKLILYIGYIMAGWTEQKQALHDIIASCLVVRKQ